MKLSFRRILLPFFLVLLGVQPAFAFKLLPISRTFTPTGSGATQSYQVINDSNERLAVQVSIVQRQMDLAGKENYKPADQDFLVYPPQILLEPQKTQIVRVTWLGDPRPTKELAYRIIAEQLPIDLEKPQANQTKPTGAVKVVLRYLGSLYIRPANVQPDVVLEGAELQKGTNSANELAISFNNRGTARGVLNKLKLHLTGQGKTIDLQPEQLKEINNAVILAGNKRRFVMPWPNNLPVGAVTAKFESE
ncbi:fimbrial biogenesis chaperone [Nostoc sp.]|uniref:fimbrial biogenesis chaperone n=1 Tax=Nostoc sp. TaxID=1180 RepID=UPI002FF4E879